MFQADPQNFRELKTTTRPDIMLRMVRNEDSGEIYVGSSDANVYRVDQWPKWILLEGHTLCMGLVYRQDDCSGSYDKADMVE